MRILISASGIQDYIFDITQRAASTRLRGRSARLGLVLDRCYERIHQEFNGQCKVRRSAGSRLEMEIDGGLDSETNALIGVLKRDLDSHSIEELDSQVWFTAVAGNSGDGIYRALAQEKLNPGRAALQVEDEKTRVRTWEPRRFIFRRKTDERKFQGKQSSDARELPEAKLGRSLANQDNRFFNFISKPTTESVAILDGFVIVSSDDPGGFAFTLKPGRFRPDLIYKALCRHAPTDKENRGLLDLNEIADRSRGAKLLGILKADLDNAGAVFSGCLDDEARTKLSQDVDTFFTEKLESLIKNNYSDAYIVYSGGDDLFLLGPWNQLIRFALDLQGKLAQSSAKWRAERLTLSAGFKLAHPKSPVRYLADNADEALASAKDSKGKNRIAVFERLLNWDELSEGIKWGDDFAQAAADRKLSVTFIQRLQYYANESRRYFERGELDALSMIPLLQNDWTRNRDQVESGLQQRMESEMLPALKQLSPSGERMWRIADFASRYAAYALR